MSPHYNLPREDKLQNIIPPLQANRHLEETVWRDDNREEGSQQDQM